MKLESKNIKPDSINLLEATLLRSIFTKIVDTESCENLRIVEVNNLSNELVDEVMKVIFSFQFEEKVKVKNDT